MHAAPLGLNTINTPPDIPGGLVFGSAPGFTWFFLLFLVSPGFSWFCSWFQNQEPHAVAPGLLLVSRGAPGLGTLIVDQNVRLPT